MAENVTPVPENEPRRRSWHARWVAAELQHTRIADVAGTLGKSVRTVQRMRAVAGWWGEVEAARREVVSDAIRVLRDALPVAAGTLAQVAGKAKAEGVRVRAAIAVLEMHGQMTARADLDERLGRIEELLAAGGRAPGRGRFSVFLGGAGSAANGR